jgi:hypothetical protein
MTCSRRADDGCSLLSYFQVDRIQNGNLILFPDAVVGVPPSSPQCMAFQTNGFFADQFVSSMHPQHTLITLSPPQVNNTCVTTSGQIYGACGHFNPGASKGYPSGPPDIRANTFFNPTSDPSNLPFNNGGCGGDSINSFAAWQKEGFDVGSTQQALDPNGNDSVQMLLKMAAGRLLLPTGDVGDFLP